MTDGLVVVGWKVAECIWVWVQTGAWQVDSRRRLRPKPKTRKETLQIALKLHWKLNPIDVINLVDDP